MAARGTDHRASLRRVRAVDGALDREAGAPLPARRPHLLRDVRRIYAGFFAALDTTRWDRPAPRGRNEWTLHETIAHLCALTGVGLDSIVHTLHGETYVFRGRETCYELDAYNRKGSTNTWACLGWAKRRPRFWVTA